MWSLEPRGGRRKASSPGSGSEELNANQCHVVWDLCGYTSDFNDVMTFQPECFRNSENEAALVGGGVPRTHREGVECGKAILPWRGTDGC